MNLRKVAGMLVLAMSVSAFSGCGMVTKSEQGIQKAEDQAKKAVAASGDGFEILAEDVEKEYQKVVDAMTKQYGPDIIKSEQAASFLQQQKVQLLDQMVSEKILDIKADELKIAADSDSIKTKLDEINKKNVEYFGSQEGFENAVKSSGQSMEEYLAMVKKNLRWQEMFETLNKDITVTEEEVKDYYEKNKDTLYTVKPGADISHIFFGKPDDPEAEKKANEAKAKLDAGAKFEDIAMEYGQDATRDKGGLLGTYPYDTKELGADFMEEVKKLENDQISAPVKTSFGWHIIKVANVTKEAVVKPFEEVKDKIEEQLLNEKKSKSIDDTMAKWENDLKVQKFPDKLLPVVIDKTPSSNTSNTSNASNASDTSNTSVPSSNAGEKAE